MKNQGFLFARNLQLHSDRETVKSSLLNKSCSNQEILENCFNPLFTFGIKYVKKCPARKNFFQQLMKSQSKES